MTRHALIAFCFIPCHAALAFQSVPISPELREVLEIDFFAHDPSKDISDRQLAAYWIQFARFEINHLTTPHRQEIVQKNPDVLDRLKVCMAHVLELQSELCGNFEDRRREYEQLANEFRDAHFDTELANAIFEVVGKEYATLIVKEIVDSKLSSQDRIKVGDWSTFGTVVENPQFKALLELTPSQKEIINRERSYEMAKLGEDVKPLMRKLAALWRDRWSDILDQLNTKQRKLALELVGKPVEWFRVPITGSLQSDGDFWISGHVFFSGSRASKNLKGKILSEYTLQELEDAGVELYSSIIYEMLFAKALWDEYELVEEQKHRLANEIENHLNEVAFVRPGPPERIDELLNQQADYPQTLKDLLLPGQLEWFQQIELQIRLGKKYDSSVGLLNPKMSKFLKLSEHQVAAIKKIAGKFESDVASVLGDLKTTRQVAEKNFATKFLETLNEHQAAKLERATGKRLGFIDH